MKKIATKIEGLYVIENFFADDNRGVFVKDFNFDDFSYNSIDTNFKEMYYSFSHKNVIRGMHFQTPPHEHEKLVNVIQGSIIDVVVDLRSNSCTKGKVLSFDLNQTNHHSLYIPKGLAHGFIALEENTIVSYKVSTTYNADSDKGVRYDTIGFNWDVENPIISQRDLDFPSLKEVFKQSYF